MGAATSSHWEGKPLVCFSSVRSAEMRESETAERRSSGKAECRYRASLSSPPCGAEMQLALGHLPTGSQPGERVNVVCKKVV